MGWRRQIRRGADYHHAALRRMAQNHSSRFMPDLMWLLTEEMRKRRRQMSRVKSCFMSNYPRYSHKREPFTASKTQNGNQKTLHSDVPPVPLPLSHTAESLPFPSANANISRQKKADYHHPFLVSSGHPQVDVLCDPSFIDKQ